MYVVEFKTWNWNWKTEGNTEMKHWINDVEPHVTSQSNKASTFGDLRNKKYTADIQNWNVTVNQSEANLDL